MKKTVTLVVSVILIICIVGILGCLVTYFNDDFQLVGDFDANDITLDYNSILYYTDYEGNIVEYDQISGLANRVWADLDDIAVDVQDAFVAIEDERFYHHPGFDIPRLAKATFNYLVKKDDSFGGSTITQQLVKNVTKDDEVRADRKIREIMRAIKLENELSKNEILEFYLNTIYLSHGCNGVQAASNRYFGKDVSELNLAEAACIAGITQYPSKYDPIDNPEANKEKQEVVLNKMLELGFISEEECQEAKEYELVFANEGLEGQNEEGVDIQSYFVDAVIDEVLNDLQTEKGYSANYAQKLLSSGGLQIYTTLDPNVQNAVETVFSDESNFSYSSYYEKQPQSAMVVMDPYSGEIRGLYGQRGPKTANLVLNRATQTLRSPGSTIKPIAVYGPAMEEGLIGPQSIIADSKLTVDGWTPQNYDRRYYGNMTIRYALEQSRNVPAVKVLQLLGVNKSFEYMTDKYHFTSLVDLREEPNGRTTTDKALASLALGGLTDGVSVKEMCAAYCVYTNDGMYITPHTYTKIYDHDGNLLLEKKLKNTQVVSKETASVMTHVMQGVVTRGTGTAAYLNSGIPVAGKTGTSEHTHDLWFCGYTPYYCGAVWYGFDTQADMSGFTSGSISASLWKKVMDIIHEGAEYKEFEMLPGVDYYNVVWIPGQKSDDDERDYEDALNVEEDEEATPPDGEIDETVEDSEEPEDNTVTDNGDSDGDVIPEDSTGETEDVSPGTPEPAPDPVPDTSGGDEIVDVIIE